MKGKKFLVWLTAMVCTVVMSIGLVGCEFEYDGNFFDKEHLKEHLIPDLPKPNAKMLVDTGSAISFEMSEEEYEQYAREVYEYMLSCNFQKLGTPGSIYATDGPHSNVHDCSDFEEYKHDGPSGGTYLIITEYIFAWSNERWENDETQWVPHFLDIAFYREGRVVLALCNHFYYPIRDLENDFV